MSETHMHEDEVLTVPEAAKLLRISRSALYSLVAAHELPHVRLSPRCIRFRRAALLAWLEEREVTSVAALTKTRSAA